MSLFVFNFTVDNRYFIRVSLEYEQKKIAHKLKEHRLTSM